MNDAAFAAACGAVGAALAKTLDFLLAWFQKRHRASREDHADERVDFNTLLTEYRRLVNELQSHITSTKREIARLQEKNVACELENAALKARVEAMEREIVRLGGEVT